MALYTALYVQVITSFIHKISILFSLKICIVCCVLESFTISSNAEQCRYGILASVIPIDIKGVCKTRNTE